MFSQGDSKLASNGERRVTMKDVGIEAGVGQTTVSFVLNGRSDMGINEETTNRVIRAAQKLGYKPRPVGRPPKSDGLSAIGIMVDELASDLWAAITVEGAQERAWEQNILLNVAMTGSDKEYEAAVLKRWSADRVLGVIYTSIVTRAVTLPTGLFAHNAVLANCYDEENRFPSIIPAERQGGQAATQVLIDAGKRRIAFITGETWTEASRQRQQGYERALHKSGLKVDPNLIVEGNFHSLRGRSATIELMSRPKPPDGIFCANDLTAIGCYEALKEMGLQVGNDVAVMGYDDSEIAQQLDPPLSTVQLPHREMGQWAIDAILSKAILPRVQKKIECPVVLRESHRTHTQSKIRAAGRLRK